jgi:hypothetical protein
MSAKRTRVKEIIGRAVSVVVSWGSAAKSLDMTVPNYEFWDKLRRGKQKGFEFGALFAMPITQIVRDAVLGDGVKAQLSDSPDDADNLNDPRVYTNQLLDRFTSRSHALLMQVVEDDYGLGDQYIIVNMDGSLSVPSPDTVKAEYDEFDYRKLVKVTVTTKLTNITITDVYTAEQRAITIKDTKGETTQFYDNLIGIIPVVHFANDRSGNETNGRPIYEALYHLMSKYDDLLRKAIDGAETMSNPFPIIEGAEDMEKIIEQNATDEGETYQDNEGNTKSRVRLALDRMTMMLLGKGASFKFASPQQGFTTDIRNMLKEVFLQLHSITTRRTRR